MEHGIALDLRRSGLSKEEFALEIGVELSRLEYWLCLAEIQVNRSLHTDHGTSGRQETPTPTALE